MIQIHSFSNYAVEQTSVLDPRWRQSYCNPVCRLGRVKRNPTSFLFHNPVKHNLVELLKDWEYSSFHCYVNKGMYELNWGASQKLIFEESVGHG